MPHAPWAAPGTPQLVRRHDVEREELELEQLQLAVPHLQQQEQGRLLALVLGMEGLA